MAPASDDKEMNAPPHSVAVNAAQPAPLPVTLPSLSLSRHAARAPT